MPAFGLPVFPSSCHRFIGSFTRSLSDSEAVRQLPDRIARFPVHHWMPLVPAALQFP